MADGEGGPSTEAPAPAPAPAPTVDTSAQPSNVSPANGDPSGVVQSSPRSTNGSAAAAPSANGGTANGTAAAAAASAAASGAGAGAGAGITNGGDGTAHRVDSSGMMRTNSYHSDGSFIDDLRDAAFDSDFFINPRFRVEPHLEVLGTSDKPGSALSNATKEYLARPMKAADTMPMSPHASDGDDNGKGKGKGKHREAKLLNQPMATGICGNNITSSCLYVIALCAEPAGKYAPIALLFICGLLYLFRRIYTEVVTALPVNGGTYNLLLNTTSKGKASAAACLTMLSYVATAVISSSSAMRYVHSLCDQCEEFNVVWATVGVLALVAILNLAGITESAGVALLIFVFHITSIVILVGASTIKAFSDMPMVDATGAVVADAVNGTVATRSMLVYNWAETQPAGGIASGLFFGFSAALLGISGFESSANYVEQQQPGVFPKTLRNMWVAVTFINPLTGFLAQCLMTVPAIAAQAESGALLSEMGAISAGNWLKTWIIVDAALVLTGAVVSSFVGFTGLVHRMTMDRCLPQFLLAQNKWRGTRHWIIIGFWTLTSLMVLFTGGEVGIMAGVYTIAFLSVMALFTVGNMLLKMRRASLPTDAHASWKVVIIAFVAVMAGLLGNIVSRDVKALQGFFIFGAVFVLPALLMLNRSQILRIVESAVTPWANRYKRGEKPKTCRAKCTHCWARRMLGVKEAAGRRVDRLTRKPMVFFTNNDACETLTQAVLYIQSNEQRRWIKFVRVFDSPEEVPDEIPEAYKFLDSCFPDMQMDYVAVVGTFGPKLVHKVSRELKIPTTFMFMSPFGDKFPYTFTELGGLRLITS